MSNAWEVKSLKETVARYGHKIDKNEDDILKTDETLKDRFVFWLFKHQLPLQYLGFAYAAFYLFGMYICRFAVHYVYVILFCLI